LCADTGAEEGVLVEGWRFGGGGKLSGAVIVAGNGAGKQRGIHDNRARGGRRREGSAAETAVVLRCVGGRQ
jgi:hypothetical protein